MRWIITSLKAKKKTMISQECCAPTASALDEKTQQKRILFHVHNDRKVNKSLVNDMHKFHEKKKQQHKTNIIHILVHTRNTVWKTETKIFVQNTKTKKDLSQFMIKYSCMRIWLPARPYKCDECRWYCIVADSLKKRKICIPGQRRRHQKPLPFH